MRICSIALLGFCPALALAQQGVWEEPPFNFGPSQEDRIMAIHLIHVHYFGTGKVVAITYEQAPNCISGRTRLWTPPPFGGPPGYSGVFASIPNCRNWLFCAGHSALADGRILTVGGHYSDEFPYADLFDPVASAWNAPSPPDDMEQGRWYPTATTLGDGTVLATSGTLGQGGALVTVPELYDPATNTWTQLFSATLRQPLYPCMFVLPDGNLHDAGAGFEGDSRILVSSSSTWTWGPELPDPTFPVIPAHMQPGYPGAAVMYEPDKVMKCGGQNVPHPTVATTFVVDLKDANPQQPPKWMVAGNMNFARKNHNLVILPDGNVLAVGGNTDGNGAGPVFAAEIFDPKSGKWSLQPPSDITQPRMYHSTAILLHDGRVVSAGGEGVRTAQIFRPPYITSEAPRPSITAYPAYMQYGQDYPIQYLTNGANEAKQVCLIRLASTTHGFDQDQRRVPLAITGSGQVPTAPSPTYQVVVKAPLNGNIAPPGYYMLFILSEYKVNEFAPCIEAKYVRVGP